jgi:hypothetical protein
MLYVLKGFKERVINKQARKTKNLSYLRKKHVTRQKGVSAEVFLGEAGNKAL